MEIILLGLLFVALLATNDPAPGWARSRRAGRTLDCERVNQVVGSQRYPGVIREPSPRFDDGELETVICRERLMRPGLRAARDEAVLSTLEERASTIAQKAAAVRPDLAERTWMVEVFYPDAPVSSKIAFATQNALVGQGLAVSDRKPMLSAGDIGVITRMAPEDAYPVACQRYAALGSVGEDDALVAVVMRDHRETILHAGLCSGGQWMWLQ